MTCPQKLAHWKSDVFIEEPAALGCSPQVRSGGSGEVNLTARCRNALPFFTNPVLWRTFCLLAGTNHYWL